MKFSKQLLRDVLFKIGENVKFSNNCIKFFKYQREILIKPNIENVVHRKQVTKYAFQIGFFWIIQKIVQKRNPKSCIRSTPESKCRKIVQCRIGPSSPHYFSTKPPRPLLSPLHTNEVLSLRITTLAGPLPFTAPSNQACNNNS